jgi:transposase
LGIFGENKRSSGVREERWEVEREVGSGKRGGKWKERWEVEREVGSGKRGLYRITHELAGVWDEISSQAHGH